MKGHSVIVIGGMIGCGKTTVAHILGDALGSRVFEEQVEGNHILPLFYTASEEERAAKRYPFLLQLAFLKTRFRDLKIALRESPHTVMDRSIYEDLYFAKVNTELGAISKDEFKLYTGLLAEMMEEFDDIPKKSPDLFVYLYASDFEEVMRRIQLRGRPFEQAPELREYYKKLNDGYTQWLVENYEASPILMFDICKYDFVERPADREKLISRVKSALMIQ